MHSQIQIFELNGNRHNSLDDLQTSNYRLRQTHTTDSNQMLLVDDDEEEANRSNR